MSTKETVIALIQALPGDVTAEEIVATLQAYYGIELSELEWSGEVTDEDWRQFVAHGLRDELADAREDIYTLEDGEPNPRHAGGSPHYGIAAETGAIVSKRYEQ